MFFRSVFRLLAISLFLMWSLNCGDDDPAPTQGSDTGGTVDAGGDVSSPDLPGDTTTTPDGTVTPDVSPDAPIIPTGGCTDNPDECTEDQECIGGGCVDPVDDIDAYLEETATRPNSYFWNIQLPSQFTPPERCCFDYTGDGRPDDALGGLLGLLATFMDPGEGEEPLNIPELITEAFYDGTITLVVDHTMFPEDLSDGEAHFAMFLGSNDVDDDGAPDDTYDERVGGLGEYLVDDASFGDYGSQIQFNLGTFEAADSSKSAADPDGTIYAGPAPFILTIPIPQFMEEPITLELEAAQIIADVTLEETGIFTTDDFTDPVEPITDPACTRTGGCPIGTFCDPSDNTCREVVNNGRLGGVLPAPQLLELLNEQVLFCDCAGVVSAADDPNFAEACTAFDCVCTDDALCGAPGACDATDSVDYCTAAGCAADVDGDGSADTGCDQTTCDYNDDGVPDACNVLTWEVNTTLGILEVSCSDNVGDEAPACGDDDGPLCGYIGVACGAMGLIGNVLDVDLDNDGVRESLSAGLRFGWSGADISGLMPADDPE